MFAIRKWLIFLFLSLYSIFVFAKVNCPSTEIVTNVQFERADGAEGIWDLFAKKFTYDNKNWNVIFTVYLPEATDNNDAIRKGSDYFKMNVVFFDTPWGRNQEDRQVCYYAQQDSTYFVRAIGK